MLEALRQPLKGGEVAVAWAAGGCCFPARFQLAATTRRVSRNIANP
jgi:predicted ATPase with chaperone activity